MTSKLPEIPFSSFLAATFASHVLYAIPTISLILLFKVTEIEVLSFIILPIVLTLYFSALSLVGLWLKAQTGLMSNLQSLLLVALQGEYMEFYSVGY
jgi:hypothetical protein